MLVKRTFLESALSKVMMGWGEGGHVNVPCTSYVICCYAAEISGVVFTLYVATLLMMG